MSEKHKPLKDIRYYESIGIPAIGKPMPSSMTDLLGIPKTAHRIGQRIACMLNLENFTVGSYDHIYVAFTTALPERQIVPTDFGHEWWQRYVACGVSPNFKSLSDAKKYDYIKSVTFDILRILQIGQSTLVDEIQKRIEKFGARTRVLRACKETKKYRFEVWFDVPPWKETAYLYVTARNNASGEIVEAAPFPLKDYEHAFSLVYSITFTNGILNLYPRKSFSASLSTKDYQTPIQFNLAKFTSQ